MRRTAWVIVVVMVVAAALSGCGEKSPDQIVKDLSKMTDKMEGYKSHGQMVIHSGTAPQKYDVEVWYKKPHFYRVSLKNTKKDVTQILLRNDEGVFVLTPHLEKSFRFQSDWPENGGGQVYLYQSLLKSIVDDSSRKITSNEKEYQFDVQANYSQNKSMNRQRIRMDRDYHPKKVEVLNEEDQVLVEITFDKFDEGASFDKNAFDMERNMTGYAGRTVPTLAKKEKKGKEKEVNAVAPAWIPEGCRLADETTVETPEGKRVIMRYKGKKPFTLTQKRPEAVDASLQAYGKPLDLGETMGVFLDMDGKRHLSWTYEGVDFELLGELTESQMAQIARSVFEQKDK
ncbi:outer membrane lipoprotein-sorting protein [Kroppenstedtia sanguinis]|uniref:Outer membrane lipoprotein carrier protein LolA n=1 Tax=Kroppenstedtia sanguinis TaxID=1380684 RepID=A0ABW4C8L5_9BACL